MELKGLTWCFDDIGAGGHAFGRNLPAIDCVDSDILRSGYIVLQDADQARQIAFVHLYEGNAGIGGELECISLVRSGDSDSFVKTLDRRQCVQAYIHGRIARSADHPQYIYGIGPYACSAYGQEGK